MFLDHLNEQTGSFAFPFLSSPSPPFSTPRVCRLDGGKGRIPGHLRSLSPPSSPTTKRTRAKDKGQRHKTRQTGIILPVTNIQLVSITSVRKEEIGRGQLVYIGEHKGIFSGTHTFIEKYYIYHLLGISLAKGN